MSVCLCVSRGLKTVIIIMSSPLCLFFFPPSPNTYSLGIFTYTQSSLSHILYIHTHLPTQDHHVQNQCWFSSHRSCQLLNSHINRRRGLTVTVVGEVFLSIFCQIVRVALSNISPIPYEGTVLFERI